MKQPAKGPTKANGNQAGNEPLVSLNHGIIAAILDAAKDLLVVVVDPEGRIVHFNPVCQRLTGYSLVEVKGRRFWDFLLASDEKAGVQATFDELLTGATNQRRNYWIAKDGRRLLIRWSNKAVMDQNGHVEYVIGTGVIVTEQETSAPPPPEREDGLEKLTPRQREVLRLLAEGRHVKEIAAKLKVSPRTVEFHKYRIMESLGLHTTAELARYAEKHGIFD